MSQNQTDQTQVEPRAQNRGEEPEPIGATILIVDDIPANQDFFKSLLCLRSKPVLIFWEGYLVFGIEI